MSENYLSIEKIVEEVVQVCKEHAEDGCFDHEGAEVNALRILKNQQKQNMKSLIDCKNEVAKIYGYESWSKIDWYQLDAMNQTKPHEQDAQDHLTNEAIELLLNERRIMEYGHDLYVDLKRQYEGLLDKYKKLRNEPHPAVEEKENLLSLLQKRNKDFDDCTAVISQLNLEVRELQDAIITNNNTIDQLTREADYREMDLQELQKKYDALKTHLKENP
jgi:hypothetical protein